MVCMALHVHVNIFAALTDHFVDHFVRNMSHLELKQFSKADYKKKVTRDMVQLLPNHDTAVLSDYAQCVSNALSREVQFLLSKRTRTSNIAETPTSPIISKLS